jgi:hypothetical protein
MLSVVISYHGLTRSSLYYQYNPERLSTCPLTVHSILHIIDGIKASGPVWAYWAFPTERHCGYLRPGVRSKRYPFASLDRYVTDAAQLATIQSVYGLCDTSQPSHHRSEFFEPENCMPIPLSLDCLLNQRIDPTYRFLDRKRGASLPSSLVQQIYAALATRFDRSVAYIKEKLPQAAIRMEQWSKVQTLGGGDMMHAAEFVSIPEDHRDASFVRVRVFLSCKRCCSLAPLLSVRDIC